MLRTPSQRDIKNVPMHFVYQMLTDYVDAVTLMLGYIEAIREIEQQLDTVADFRRFDDIVVACGSGGTIAGLSLGSWLSNLKAKVHAFSVCDDPDYFYDFVQGLLDGLKADICSHDIVNIKNVCVLVLALKILVAVIMTLFCLDVLSNKSSRSAIFIAKGLGYAINTQEELKFVKDIAAATGVILDPVYRYVLTLETILLDFAF
ncbi:Bifunctional D-cysteine desulfhydrase/1-aminocyclopropane-1-carboxylate deaminase mitochondrial [Bienertia sinuspersici]